MPKLIFNTKSLVLRKKLAKEISNQLQRIGRTQTEQALMLQTTQGKISDLRAGKVDGFSLDRLVVWG